MIYIGSDHVGFDTKTQIKIFLSENNYQFTDIGSNSADIKADYPDIAKITAEKINDQSDKGILICGTGIGMSIAANRYPHIRAALAWNEEVAEKSKSHNDANVLCLSARNVSNGENIKIVKKWFETDFSQEKRHVNRIAKLK